MLQHIDLNQDENAILHVPKEDFEANKQAYVNSYYAKLLSNKEYNINGLRNVLSRAWKILYFKIFKMDKNIFHIFFTTMDDMKNIISRGLWYIENHLLISCHGCLLPQIGIQSFSLLTFGVKL